MVKGRTKMEENNTESNDVVAKDAELPEQSSSIVGDAPPPATSKKKKIIMLGCGFCVLLFLVCAGIGLPMVAKLRESVEQAVEEVGGALEESLNPIARMASRQRRQEYERSRQGEEP